MFKKVGINTLMFLVLFAKDKQMKNIKFDEVALENLILINQFLDYFVNKNPLSFIEHVINDLEVTVKITPELEDFIREEVPEVNEDILNYLAKEYIHENLAPFFIKNIENIKRGIDMIRSSIKDYLREFSKFVKF